MGVEGVRGREPGHRHDLGGGEGREHHLDAPLMERAAVGGQLLHHGQVAADEDEQHGFPAQYPVPDGLQGAFQYRVAFEHPGQLVEYDDAGGVVREYRGELAKGGVPFGDGCDAGEELGVGQRGVPDLGEEAGPFPVGVLAPGGLVHDVRHLGALTEEVYESGLPDPASAAEQQGPAALVAPAVAYPGEVAFQGGQLGLATYEAWHGSPSEFAHIEHTQVNHSMDGSSS